MKCWDAVVVYRVGRNYHYYNKTAGNTMRCVIARRETTAGVTAAGGIEKRKAPQPRPRSLRYTSDRATSWTAA